MLGADSIIVGAACRGPRLAACADAAGELAARRTTAIINGAGPQPSSMVRRVDNRAVNDLGTDAVIRSIAIASGLGTTPACSWLKIPVVTTWSG